MAASGKKQIAQSSKKPTTAAALACLRFGEKPHQTKVASVLRINETGPKTEKRKKEFWQLQPLAEEANSRGRKYIGAPGVTALAAVPEEASSSITESPDLLPLMITHSCLGAFSTR